MPSRSDEFATERENIEATYATAYPIDREAERKRQKAEELAEVRRKALERGWRPTRRRKPREQGTAVPSGQPEEVRHAPQPDYRVGDELSGAGGTPQWNPTPAPPLAPPDDVLPDDFSGVRPADSPTDIASWTPPRPPPEPGRITCAQCKTAKLPHEFNRGSHTCKWCMMADERASARDTRPGMTVAGVTFTRFP